jgi:hypothetical protein
MLATVIFGCFLATNKDWVIRNHKELWEKNETSGRNYQYLLQQLAKLAFFR